MNPNPPNPSRDEIEARITALLLGELPESEAALLRWTISQDAELAKLHARLKYTIELTREVATSPAEEVAAQAVPLKLSSERREKLLAQLKTITPKEPIWNKRFEFPRLVEIAAVLAILALFAAMLLPALSKAKSKAQRASSMALTRQRELEQSLSQSKETKAPEEAQYRYFSSSMDRVGFDEAVNAGQKAGEPSVSTPVEKPHSANNIILPSTATENGNLNITVAENTSPAPHQSQGFSVAGPLESGDSLQLTRSEPSDKLSLLGDVPFVGQLERSENTSSANNFTATSPAGTFPEQVTTAGAVNSDQVTRNDPGLYTGVTRDDVSGLRYLYSDNAVAPVAEPAQSLSPQLGRTVTTISGRENPVDLGVNAADENTLAANGTRTPPTMWGSFDGVANGPIIYAAGSDISESLAKLDTARGGGGGGADSPGVNIAARFSEIAPNENRSWGFDWYAGTQIGAQGGTSPSEKPELNQSGEGKLTLSAANTINGGIIANAGNFALNKLQSGKDQLPAFQNSPDLDGEESLQQIGVRKDREIKRELAASSSPQDRGEEYRRLALVTNNVNAVAVDTFPEVQLAEQKTDTAAVRNRVMTNFDVPAEYISDIIPIRYAGLDEIGSSLNTLFNSGRGKPEIQLHNRTKIIRDERSKSLLIFATSEDMEILKEAIAKLDSKENDKPIPKPAPNAAIPQPEIQTRENNFSTFSLNVSDVSFKLAAASLEKGQLPDAASIRTEEFINAFDYRDPEPEWDSASSLSAAGKMPAPLPVAFASERAHYPFAHNRDLLRFSIKTGAQGRQAGRPLNLVLLLDNSGSMERADRVAIIREALRVLAAQLQPQDRISIITFARTPRLWADGVAGDKAGESLDQVGGITPEGGTNLEEAMKLAYATALRHYLADGANRVVLLTDGAANLGNVEPEALKQKVESFRKQGIALDCFGIGWEGYNDDLLEQLSSNGDGRYGFINTPEETATGFAGQLAGALKVAASDVKVQVEFNPKRVISYRQIGYAKHQLTKEQFRDNTVDAAEIAAQEAGNALYTVETNPQGEGPIATVRVRYKVPGTTDYREQAWDVPYTGNAVALEQSSAAMRLAATASAFSEWLAQSPFAQEITPDALLKILNGVPQVYGADGRPTKLEWMIRQAKSLAGK